MFLFNFSLWYLFWIMEYNGHERDEDGTLVSKPVRLLRDGHRVAVESSAVTLVRNLPIALQSWEASLERVAAPIAIVQNSDMFDGLGNMSVSEEGHTLKTLPTQSR